MKKRIFIFLLAVMLILLSTTSCSYRYHNNVNIDSKSNQTNAPIEPSGVNTKKVSCSIGNPYYKIWTDLIGTQYIFVSAPVTNDGNVPLYMSSANIEIEDSSGNLMDTMSYVSVCPQVIKPGETAYFYNKTFYNATAKDNLIITLRPKVFEAKVEQIRFATSDVNINTGSGIFGKEITGRTFNHTNTEFSLVPVSALFFDAANNLIGIERSIVDVPAGTKSAFKITSLTDDYYSEWKTYLVIVEPTQYQF